MSALSHNRAIRLVLGVAHGLLLAGATGVLAIGIVVLVEQILAVGWLLIAVGVIVSGLAILLYTHAAVGQKQSATMYRTYLALLDAVDELHRQSAQIHTIAENSSLSDWSKQIVYREKDFEYLRDQIRAAFIRDDWAGAERMIRDMADKLGHTDEAERLRVELDQARQATLSEKIVAALARFEELCAAQRWQPALAEVERLTGQYPEEERIQALPALLNQRRSEHKRALLKQYDDAVSREDVDAAHQLLLQLDMYLTANEVAALKDSARGVFRARLMQLGARFSVAVNDRRFDDAIRIGELVIKEYPNSRYAHEITEMLPALQRRISP